MIGWRLKHLDGIHIINYNNYAIINYGMHIIIDRTFYDGYEIDCIPKGRRKY